MRVLAGLCFHPVVACSAKLLSLSVFWSFVNNMPATSMLKKNRMAFPLLHFKEGCLSFKAIAVITIMISQCETSKELNSSVYTRVFMEDHPTMWLCEQILVPHRSSNTHIQFTRAFLFYLECIFICSPHIYSRWSQLTSVNTHRLTVAHTHLNPDINPAVWFNHSESQGKSGFMTRVGVEGV